MHSEMEGLRDKFAKSDPEDLIKLLRNLKEIDSNSSFDNLDKGYQDAIEAQIKKIL
jgi:hypothetical protein